MLVSICPSVPYGWLYTKRLERAKFLALQGHNCYNKKMVLSHGCRTDSSWWTSHLLNARQTIAPRSYTLEIVSDASTCGAVCGSKKAHGLWSHSEQFLHIDHLELLAAFFALKCFAQDMNNCSILLRIDNTTAIAYINRMGGVQYPALTTVARDIWQWCELRKLFIFASYIGSSMNVEADREYRRLRMETEWELADYAFQAIVSSFGTPDIDLFADRNNKKCSDFVSWRRDPDALAVDAFTISWSRLRFYDFLPFSLILRVLQKIISDNATGLLVVPLWKTQPWFPLFSALLIKEPVIFSPNSNLLISSSRSPHPLSKNLSLVAGLLSHKPSTTKDYRLILLK